MKTKQLKYIYYAKVIELYCYELRFIMLVDDDVMYKC